MWFIEHIREVGVLGILLVLAVTLSRLSRKDEALAQAAVERKADEALTAADYACQGCGAAHPRYRSPQIVEVRSIVEWDWLDALLLRLGFHRAVEHTVQVDYGNEDGRVYCKSCANFARARCEHQLHEFKTGRAAAGVIEARTTAEFNAFALREAVFEATTVQRGKLAAIEAERTRAEAARKRARAAALPLPVSAPPSAPDA